MKIILGGRRCGKTTKCIEWLKEDLEHRIMLVHSLEEKRRLMIQYDLPEKNVHTWESYKKTTIGLFREPPEAIIDNAEEFIHRHFRDLRLKTVTMTVENWEFLGDDKTNPRSYWTEEDLKKMRLETNGIFWEDDSLRILNKRNKNT